MNWSMCAVKTRRMWLPIVAVVAGLVIGVAGAVWVLCPVEVPRPSAPRATDASPCADCVSLPPVNTLGAKVNDTVTESVQRPAFGVCPAGFRGSGWRGSDGRCRSNTTFKVSSELLPGLFRTPGQEAIARCELGKNPSFEIVSVRDSGVRDEATSNCDEVRCAQPELADVTFDVHQLNRLQQYTAETLDTASARQVAPERVIGYHRIQTLNVNGATAGL